MASPGGNRVMAFRGAPGCDPPGLRQWPSVSAGDGIGSQILRTERIQIMMNGWDMGGMGCMGGMALMGIAGLLLLAGAVVLVVVLVKAFTDRSGNRGGSRAGADSGGGQQILEERYARGEISGEEYRERLRTLEEDGR